MHSQRKSKIIEVLAVKGAKTHVGRGSLDPKGDGLKLEKNRDERIKGPGRRSSVEARVV